MLAGIALVVAAGCVFNNILDRAIDSAMARTRTRALVSGTISPKQALSYGLMLGTIGLLILAVGTNLLTTALALAGLVIYVAVYGFWKRRSVHGTLVGSLAGAVPLVAGYCAASNQFDRGAWLLFIILALWQMPHFYAIAMYRLGDYKAAKLPVLPAVKGMKATKRSILGYILAFIIATSTLTVFGYTGYSFAGVMIILGLAWFIKGVRGLHVEDNTKWARSMFSFSLVVLMSLSVMLSVGAILP